MTATVLPSALAAAGLVEAVEAGDGRAHADGGVDGGQGRHRAQGVAADVAQHRQLVLCQGVEETAVGTAGAHDRGPGGNGLLQLHALSVWGMPSCSATSVLAQLVNAGEERPCPDGMRGPDSGSGPQ